MNLSYIIPRSKSQKKNHLDPIGGLQKKKPEARQAGALE